MRWFFSLLFLSMASPAALAQGALNLAYQGGIFSNATILDNSDLLLTGSYYASSGNYHVIRVASDGSVIWARSLGEKATGDVVERPNGDLVLGFDLYPDSGQFTPASITLDATGNFVEASYFWMDTLDVAGQESYTNASGHRVTMFWGSSSLGLISLDEEGAFRWCSLYPGTLPLGVCIAPGGLGATMLFYPRASGKVGFRHVSSAGVTLAQREYDLGGTIFVQAAAEVAPGRWAVLCTRIVDNHFFLLFVQPNGDLISAHAYEHPTDDFFNFNGRLTPLGNGKLIVTQPKDGSTSGVQAMAMVDTSGQILHMMAQDTTTSRLWRMVPADTSWGYYVHSQLLIRRPIDDLVGPCEDMTTVTHAPFTVTTTTIAEPSTSLFPAQFPFTPDITTISVTASDHCISTGSRPEAAFITPSVHPNPMQGDALWIEGLAKGVFPYHVYDAAGRLWLGGQWTSDQALDLGALPPGTYLLEVVTRVERYRWLLVR